MTGTRLESLAAVLSAALDTWATRDDTKAQPGVSQAANEAVAAVDDMLAALHKIRSQLVTEIRRSDDAALARADALLAGCRARREAGGAR